MVKKHQFVKADCACARRASVYTCKYCGTMEYSSLEELRQMQGMKAVCPGEGAPEALPMEVFKERMGGAFDCLAPDYATWTQGKDGQSQV